jgi:type I restriction enzyme S subunit
MQVQMKSDKSKKSHQSRVQTYSRYKDSGVDWLGDIPEHWETKRSKFLWTETTNLSKEGNEQLLSVSQYVGVKTNKNESRSENLIGYKKVCKDNLVTNIMLAWLGGLGISNFDGVVSPAYSIYQASNEILPRFAHYLYRTKIYLDEFARRSSGIVSSRWRMYTDDFGEVRTILPPKPEQEAIANFLDETCGKLDIVVAEKEKMIALLKELKQALIQKVVTRGLDENVPMKDSGVDWIGEIPVGWEKAKVKNVSLKISKGTTPSTEGQSILSEGSVRYIKSENIFEGSIKSYPRFFISDKTNKILSRSQLQKDDILFVIAGASLGKTAIISEKEIPSNTNQAVSFIRPNKKIIPKFLIFWLTSDLINQLLWLDAVQSAQPNLSMEDLGNFPIFIPPKKEQEKIVNYIDTQSQKTDQAVRQQEQAIVKLKEYKASLVDSCVLGKVKVS